MKPVKKFLVYKVQIKSPGTLIYLADIFINEFKTKFNQGHLPNDDFLLNSLKTLFRLSRVLLDL